MKSHLAVGFSRALGAAALAFAALSGTMAAPTQAVPVDVSCNALNVVVWNVNGPRVHVQCVETFGSGIRFFAFPSTDAAAVARVLTILTTARAAGSTLVINTDLDDAASGPPFGCQAADCRVIRAVGF